MTALIVLSKIILVCILLFLSLLTALMSISIVMTLSDKECRNSPGRILYSFYFLFSLCIFSFLFVLIWLIFTYPISSALAAIG